MNNFNASKFYFIGVTTTKSSIMRVFPRWMKVIGRDEVEICGYDLKIHDTSEAYREVVSKIKNEPQTLGALVTTHKIDILHATRDLFDYLDDYALLTNEISSISKNNGRLEGHAKDPISSGLSLDAIIGEGYFEKTGGHVLCFGAGGSAIATFLHLSNKPLKSDRPQRFIFVNRSQGRLDHAMEMIDHLNTDILVEYVQNSDPAINDKLMEELPDFSIVINATGMGKDTPGSPITWSGQFPSNGVVWEFNYRGELDFLHQAHAQKENRSLIIEDGWLYFVHGWTQVVSQVLHFDLTPEIFSKLQVEAGFCRVSN